MPPSSPDRPRRSPLTVMVAVVGAVLALLVLGVMGLLGWNAWRPPSAADYTRLEQESALTSDFVTLLAAEVGRAPAAVSAPGPDQVQQLVGAIELQTVQLQDQTAALDRLRAADDPEVARRLQTLHTAVDELDGYLERYSTALLPLQGAGAACPSWDTELDLAAGPSAEQIASASAPCLQRVQSLREVPDGAWQTFADAHAAHVEDYAALAERVRGGEEDAAGELTGLHERYLQRLQQAAATLDAEVAERGQATGTAVDDLRGYAREQAAG
ncbi:hypothetical protein [Desertihabitans aurantiacus]|uniref:hypothetical protein n=1 Tax=Desertihabitans aurantiacus TaxID=2282477 RepID=UPI0013006326|nr:hypothetical protein [Desertihabitans aurantiacus]